MFAEQQQREDIQKRREEWKKLQSNKKIGNNIVFLDETSVNCSYTRLYGRALGKERVKDYVPDFRFERTSLIAGISLTDIKAPFLFKGTLNKDIFRKYVKEHLAKSLNKGDTLIMDNCSVHKVKDILKPLEEKGIKIIFLPPYSPDLNPIENIWSTIKSYLRKWKARTYDALEQFVEKAINIIDKMEISRYFEYCGYFG